ncbi:CTL-like protein 2 isoform X4 [Contarinia nasturtii]|uniref:CTL-like protein 2 isoform X4 n=1 Tax=Contarinia nasturtii TaxID=265458 RepID=UPI0012D4AF9B|nr:CTL-like protein 2 isoform X4 [Contarinia nasturtii]
MGCCFSNDNQKSVHPSVNDVSFEQLPMSETIKYDQNFKGPLSKRSCTDVCCLFIFIVFLCCWGFVAQFAIKNGDLDRLLVPTDSSGRKCGVDNGVVNEPYLLFFNLEKCIDPTVPLFGCKTPQVCVRECPTTTFIFDKYQCNPSTFPSIRDKLICQKNENKFDIRDCDDIQNRVDRGSCASWYLPSKPFAKLCIPNDVSLMNNIKSNSPQGNPIKSPKVSDLLSAVENIKFFAEFDGMGQRIVEDLMKIRWAIAADIFLAMFFCLIVIAVMRWVARPLVWLSILGVIVMLGFATYYSFTQYVYFRDRPPTDVNVHTNLSLWINTLLQKPSTWLTLGIVAAIVLIIILLVVLVLRKRILIAIALVKEGSKVVSSIYSTVFFPIFPWILQIIVTAFAVAVGLYLSSIGTPKNQVLRMSEEPNCHCFGNASHYKDGVTCDPFIFNAFCKAGNALCEKAACNFKEIESPRIVPYFQALNVFGFFWGIFFVSALGEMVLAATFATWYWTFHKKDVPYFTLTVGLGRSIRYHLGTVAFGSLIITICRVIRVILEYIDEKLKKWDNEFTQCVLCCCKCFFWCLERFLRFLSKNAYIMCAIHGKPFCSSARDAFNLLMRNFLRVVALDKVTEFLFFLTKILITVGMGAVTYVYFTSERYDDKLNYVQVPVVIVMFATYLIASVFFGVYSMCVDTLFLCFLEDCERNDGSEEKPYFMSKQLMKILGKKNIVPRDQYQES